MKYLQKNEKIQTNKKPAKKIKKRNEIPAKKKKKNLQTN